MADIKFGAYSQAIYGDVERADRPKSSGITLVKINRYSGRPLPDTEVELYGNNPKDVVERLYVNGQLANGLVNNKLYENGQEVSKEQAQAGANVNYAQIAGELATLGIRTPVGTGGSQFVRDTAAEKKTVQIIRENLKSGRPPFEGVLGAGILGSEKTTRENLSAASDDELIAFVGGVNKEGVIGANYGINALYDPYSSPVNIARLPGGLGYGTGIYGGSGPGQYERGSRAITESDILALGKVVGNAAKDPQAAANASRQLISIFENDSSWLRREQARDALSYGLPGYPGGPEAPTSARGATGVMGAGGAATFTASDGRQFSSPEAYTSYQANLDTKKASRQSAYDELYQEFDQYGLASLVTPLKSLIEDGLDVRSSAFKLKLRESEEYKKRFAANAQRVQKGLRALNEATYIGLEDQYQQIMRAYGLPESYYARGELGRQEGFEKFIAGDVSAPELEDRIQTAQNRVINAAPEVSKALREFYPDISNGDILAYALDPQQAITNIKRKVTAAEIGAGAMQAGLSASAARAEELQRLGITGEAARQGFQTIGSFLPRATQLGDIYAKQGMGPFTQTTAEAEVFGTPGAVDAAQKRRRLSELEQAQFGGSTGIAQGALGRERAGQF